MADRQIKCSNCGKLASDRLRICPFCGKWLKLAPVVASPVQQPIRPTVQFLAPPLPPAPLIPACTVCGNHDVRRVSAEFAAGSWHGSTNAQMASVGHIQHVGHTGSVGSVRMQHRGMSTIAAMLAPPEQPKPRRSTLVVLGIFLFFISMCLVPVLTGSSSSSSSRSSTDVSSEARPGDVMMLVAVLIGAGSFVTCAIAGTRQDKQFKLDNVAYEMQWNYLMDIWEGCYYCPKCDNTIEPRSRRFVRSQDFQRLINSFRTI